MDLRETMVGRCYLPSVITVTIKDAKETPSARVIVIVSVIVSVSVSVCFIVCEF